MIWEPGHFWIATGEASSLVHGWTCQGLGLHAKAGADEYALVHTASGLRLCVLTGRIDQVVPIAGEIADCADWRARQVAWGATAMLVLQVLARQPAAAGVKVDGLALAEFARAAGAAAHISQQPERADTGSVPGAAPTRDPAITVTSPPCAGFSLPRSA